MEMGARAMTVDTARSATPSTPRPGPLRPGATRPGPAEASRLERWYTWLDTVLYLAVLNVLVLAFTLAGAVVLGWAPAVSAAVTCSRHRIRGRSFPVVRTFAAAWRDGFLSGNLLAAPAAVTLALLATSALALRDRPGTGVLVGALVAAAAVCVAHLLLVFAMDAHFELRRRDCLRLAWAFMVRFPGAPLLLVATTALATVVTALVPGLAPVISVGAWLHLCTALCLSFFAANDRHLDGEAADRPTTSDR
jgi:uncharacterized membrane protein YesL